MGWPSVRSKATESAEITSERRIDARIRCLPCLLDVSTRYSIIFNLSEGIEQITLVSPTTVGRLLFAANQKSGNGGDVQTRIRVKEFFSGGTNPKRPSGTYRNRG